MGHQLIINIEVINLQMKEAVKVREEHQAKIDRLLKEKSIKIRGLQEAIQNFEQALTKAKKELASETKKRKKVEVEIEERERQILEAKDQAIQD